MEDVQKHNFVPTDTGKEPVKSENALQSFAHGLAYGLVEQPYEGVAQLVNGASHICGGGDLLPKAEFSSTSSSTRSTTGDFAEKAGEVAGMLPWVVGINCAVHAGAARFGLAESLPALAKPLMPAFELGATGAIDQGIFTPSQDNGNMFEGRLTNAFNGFAIFGSAAALSMGMRAAANGLIGADTLASRSILSHGINAGIYGSTGFGASMLGSGLDKLEGGNGLSLRDKTEYGLLGAVAGGLAKLPPETFQSATDLHNKGVSHDALHARMDSGVVTGDSLMNHTSDGSGGSGSARVSSGITTESLYARSPELEFSNLDANSALTRDIAAEVRGLDASRQLTGDSLGLSDRYMHAATDLAQRGALKFPEMMDSLNKSLEIRTNLLPVDDPLLGITNRYAYNVSAGRVPTDVSIGYLQNSMNVWEQLAKRNELPDYVTQHYLNTGYKNLQIMYEGQHQPALAQQAASKIK